MASNYDRDRFGGMTLDAWRAVWAQAPDAPPPQPQALTPARYEALDAAERAAWEVRVFREQERMVS